MYKKRLEDRLKNLSEAVGELVELGERQRRLDKTKKEVAELIVGEPYYWGDWYGIIEAHSNDPTKVVAHLKRYKSKEEVYWIFDSLTAYETVKETAKFSSYSKFREAQMSEFGKDFEKLLRKHGIKEVEVQVRMKLFYEEYS